MCRRVTGPVTRQGQGIIRYDPVFFFGRTFANRVFCCALAPKPATHKNHPRPAIHKNHGLQKLRHVPQQLCCGRKILLTAVGHSHFQARMGHWAIKRKMCSGGTASCVVLRSKQDLSGLRLQSSCGYFVLRFNGEPLSSQRLSLPNSTGLHFTRS